MNGGAVRIDIPGDKCGSSSSSNDYANQDQALYSIPDLMDIWSRTTKLPYLVTLQRALSGSSTYEYHILSKRDDQVPGAFNCQVRIRKLLTADNTVTDPSLPEDEVITDFKASYVDESCYTIVCKVLQQKFNTAHTIVLPCDYIPQQQAWVIRGSAADLLSVFTLNRAWEGFGSLAQFFSTSNTISFLSTQLEMQIDSLYHSIPLAQGRLVQHAAVSIQDIMKRMNEFKLYPPKRRLLSIFNISPQSQQNTQEQTSINYPNNNNKTSTRQSANNNTSSNTNNNNNSTINLFESVTGSSGSSNLNPGNDDYDGYSSDCSIASTVVMDRTALRPTKPIGGGSSNNSTNSNISGSARVVPSVSSSVPAYKSNSSKTNNSNSINSINSNSNNNSNSSNYSLVGSAHTLDAPSFATLSVSQQQHR